MMSCDQIHNIKIRNGCSEDVKVYGNWDEGILDAINKEVNKTDSLGRTYYLLTPQKELRITSFVMKPDKFPFDTLIVIKNNKVSEEIISSEKLWSKFKKKWNGPYVYTLE